MVACSPGRSARSTRSSSTSPGERRRARASWVTPSGAFSSEGSRPGRATEGARFAGFADAVGRALAELDGALLEPRDLDEPLASLAAAYRAELERIDGWDRGMLRRRAVERLTSDLGAWGDSPVFAYGFEDLTGAEWRLLEALAARAEVHVSIPYEPGRAVYASLRRTVDDLASLAGEAVVELPPRAEEFLPAPLAHVERALFTETPRRSLLDGSLRWLEGAGARGTLELVAETVLAQIRAGTPPHEIAVVCPSVDAVRLALGTAFAAVGVPVAFEGRARTRDDAVRPRPPVAASLRLGRRRAAPALRASSLPVLGSRAQGGRLDRGPPPRAGDRARRPRRRGRRRAPRGSGTAAARPGASRRVPDRCRPRARRRRCCETRTARRRLPQVTAPGSTCGRTTR